MERWLLIHLILEELVEVHVLFQVVKDLLLDLREVVLCRFRMRMTHFVARNRVRSDAETSSALQLCMLRVVLTHLGDLL